MFRTLNVLEMLRFGFNQAGVPVVKNCCWVGGGPCGVLQNTECVFEALHLKHINTTFVSPCLGPDQEDPSPERWSSRSLHVPLFPKLAASTQGEPATWSSVEDSLQRRPCRTHQLAKHGLALRIGSLRWLEGLVFDSVLT